MRTYGIVHYVYMICTTISRLLDHTQREVPLERFWMSKNMFLVHYISNCKIHHHTLAPTFPPSRYTSYKATSVPADLYAISVCICICIQPKQSQSTQSSRKWFLATNGSRNGRSGKDDGSEECKFDTVWLSVLNTVAAEQVLQVYVRRCLCNT